MRIEESFEVPAAIDLVWSRLLDVEQVVACIPGAELTGAEEEGAWPGRLNVSFGPVSMTFRGSVALERSDDMTHTLVLTGRGIERKGKGSATVAMTLGLEPTSTGTRASLAADVTLIGVVAQIARGLLPGVAANMTARFADRLRDSLAERADP